MTSRILQLSALCCGALLLLAGCDQPVEPEGGDAPVPLAVQASTAGSAMVEVIAVEVTGQGIPVPIIANLQVVDGAASGTVRVPPGQARTFTGRAYDEAANLTHEGAVTTDVRPGQAAVRIPMPPRGVGVPIEVTVGSFTVSIAPGSASLDVGATLQFEATVTDADGAPVEAPELIWASANPAFATSDADGLVTGHHPGTTRIVASFQGVAAEAELTVGPAADPPSVTITSPSDGDSFEAGDEVPFLGSAVDGEGESLTGDDLVWTSSQDGQIGTGAEFVRDDLSVGEHTITLTATDGDGRTASATVAIEITESAQPPVLTSIVVSPESAQVTGDATEQFTATAYDQFGQEMPDVEFEWTTVHPCIADVDGSGLATTVGAVGSATIRASVEDVAGSGVLNVTQPVGADPESLAGDWKVCRVTTGAHVLTLHLNHEVGSTSVTGTVSSITASGAIVTSVLRPISRWEDGRLSLHWIRRVQSIERSFSITQGAAQNENLLRGLYLDMVVVLDYDVDIVRLMEPAL